jgi:lysophospholipase L1-like esterase
LLRKQGYDFTAPEIIAKTGWTAEELGNAVSRYTFSPKYDFVSLLTGVNNQYRGQDIILYKEQFETLLKKALELVGGKKEHLFILSIPDYSTTPFARSKEAEKISKEIDEFNKLNRALSIQYKIPYIDINESPQPGKDQEGLVAADGLHPSAEAYTKWAKKLAEAIARLVKK